jgi:flagellar biosynthesis protein FlhA
VPIRDLARILEAITERAQQTKAHEALLEAARVALGPTISAKYAAPDGRLPVVTLDPTLEQSLVESLRQVDDRTVLGIDAAEAERLLAELARVVTEAEARGTTPVVVVTARLRAPLEALVRSALPRVGVMSVQEIGPQVRPERVGVVSRVAQTV